MMLVRVRLCGWSAARVGCCALTSLTCQRGVRDSGSTYCILDCNLGHSTMQYVLGTGSTDRRLVIDSMLTPNES